MSGKQLHNNSSSEESANLEHSDNSSDNGKKVKAKKRHRFHWCRLLFWIGLIFFIFITTLLSILLFTGVGQRFVITQADDYINSFSIKKVTGRLQDGLIIDGIQFHSPGVEGDIQEVELKLNFECLLDNKICINKFIVKQPNVDINTALLPKTPTNQQTSQPVRKITLPLDVVAKDLQIHDLTLNIDQQKFTLTNFNSGLELTNTQGITLLPTEIEHIIFTQTTNEQTTARQDDLLKRAAQQGSIKKKIDDSLKTSVSQLSRQAELPPQVVNWSEVKKRLQQPFAEYLDNFVLPIAIHIPHLEGNDWQYVLLDQQGGIAQKESLSQILLQADIVNSQANIKALQIDSSLGHLSLNGDIAFQGSWPITLKLDSHIENIYWKKELVLPATQVALNVAGELTQNVNLTLNTQGAINANLDFIMQTSRKNNPFSISLKSPKFQLPLANSPRGTERNNILELQNINLLVGGDFANYHLDLSGSAVGQAFPLVRVLANGEGKLTQFKLNDLKVELGKGVANLTGQLNWENALSWNANLLVNKLDSRHFLKDWPAVLSGSINSTGAVSSQHWQVDVPKIDIIGELHKQQFKLAGDVELSDKQLLRTSKLVLEYGKNNIQVVGEIGDKSDLNVDIETPKLDGLIPRLRASIKGNAHIKGNITQPNISVNLQSPNLSFDNYKANNLSLIGDIDTKNNYKGRLYLNFNKLELPSVQLNNGKLSATGDLSHQELQLKVAGNPVSGQLSIYGGFDRATQKWHGIANKIIVHSPIGDWNSLKNIPITYDSTSSNTTIGKNCWNNAKAEICFPRVFSVGKEGKVPFQINNLKLSLLDSFLNEETRFSGTINSEGEVSWGATGITASVDLHSPLITLKQKVAYRNLKYQFSNVALNALLQNNELKTKLSLLFDNQAPLKADISIGNLDNDSRTLRGTLSLEHLNLAMVNDLLPPSDKVEGDINTNLTFSGKLLSPQIFGDIQAQRLVTHLNGLPINIKQGNLGLTFKGQDSTLSGSLYTSDKGRLDLGGNATWSTLDKWRAVVTAKGDNLMVVQPGLARLSITPDVKVEATPDLVKLTGQVNVPWARIAVKELPESAVDVSSDMVIVKDKKVPILKPSSSMQIESDIRLKIGNDVSLSAYGLKAKLQGLLAIRQEKNLGIYGSIQVIDGHYSSFGQDLLVRKGDISFSGLANEPYLNIEAVRNPEAMSNSDIVAGIKVTGIASQPIVKVFSEPAMSQAEALSYLLSGRGLDSGTQNGSGAVASAVIGLGLSRTGQLVGDVGKAFGISNFSLDTKGVGNSSQVVVSGYITPRLQIKYGVGIFEPLAELTVRYRLLPQLFLQSVSGVDQAFDLLYQFSF